jgi:hypothetical protein
MALRVLRRPPAFDISAFAVSFAALRILPLAMLVLMASVFFSSDKFESDPPPVYEAVTVGCAVWAVAMLIPLQGLRTCCGREETAEQDPRSAIIQYQLCTDHLDHYYVSIATFFNVLYTSC